MLKGKLSRSLAILMSGTIIMSLAACGSAPSKSESSSGSSGSASGSEQQPLSFTMMCNYNAVEPPKKDGMLTTYLKDKLNTTVDITWIPTTAYNDKLNAQIAAADLPNVVAVRDPRESSSINAVRTGMFWALDKYITPDYANFNRLNKGVLNNLKVDGALYALPRERDIARAGIYFRSDWLKKLGLSAPTNMDELYNVVKAFTENDPDGNGAKDTTGISMKGRNLGDFLINVSIYYGGPREWFVADDGTIKNQVDTPEYQKALDFFRDAYKNGYMISDFTVNTDETVPFKSGKAGLVFANAISDGNNAAKNIKELFPNAVVDVTQDIKTPAGKTALRAHLGYAGVLMFPKTKTRTEDELVRILKFFDELGNDEHIMFLKNGVQGTHYEIKDNFVVKTDEQNKLFTADLPDLDQFYPYGLFNPLPVKQPTELAQKIVDSMALHTNDVVYDAAEPYISETNVTLGKTLTDILTDARMKYVIGEIDLAGWQKAVKEWKVSGGDKVAAEYTQQYKDSKK